QQIALRLRHEECRREARVVALLLGIEPLLRERRARPRGIDPFRGAPNLTARLSNRSRGFQLQARDACRRLTTLDIGTRAAGLLVTVSERLRHRHADAPRRIIGAERLAERVAEAARARADDRAGEAAAAQELAAGEPRAAIRRLEPDIG